MASEADSEPGQPTPTSTTEVEAPPQHVLPEWFLSKNVQTPEQLKDARPKIRWIDREGQDGAAAVARTETIPDAASATTEATAPTETTSKATEAAFGVSHQLFTSVRDTLAALMMRDASGKLPMYSMGATMQCKAAESDDVCREYVQALAKEFNATLTTVSLDDFRSLATTYGNHTPVPPAGHGSGATSYRRPTKESGYEVYHPADGPLLHHFGQRCQRNVSEEGAQITKRAFAPILDLAGDKPDADADADDAKDETSKDETSSDEIPKDDGVKNETPKEASSKEDISRDETLTDKISKDDTSKEEETGKEEASKDAASKDETLTAEVSKASQVLMIHLAMARQLLPLAYRKVLCRLREAVYHARAQGRSVVLLITSQVDEKSNQEHYRGKTTKDYRLFQFKGGIPPAATFILRPVEIPDQLKQPIKPEETASNRFVLGLKAMLRQYAGQYFDEDLLLPSTQWDLKVDNEHINLDGSDIDLMEEVAVQVAGRAWNKEKLNVDDVVDVLDRISLAKKLRHDEGDTDSNSDNDSNSDSSNSDSDSDSDDEKAGYEKEMLEYMVKIEDMNSTGLDDVILKDEVKATVKQMIMLTKMKVHAKSSVLLSRLQVKGALFYGPPGTGKTHLCRAIAQTMGCNMLALDSAALEFTAVGRTEKSIRAAFTVARKHAPCIVFFDEVDALFYRRGNCDKKWERTTLTQFLQELDGLTSRATDAPFVLVATNRPMDLDPAFLRRLPQKIHFGLPDEQAREKILNVLLHKDDILPDVDLKRLAALTDGYSGSDLNNLCGEAALLWAMEYNLAQNDDASAVVENLPTVQLSNAHFIHGLQKIRPTVSKKQLRELDDFRHAFNPASSGNGDLETPD